MPPLAERRPPPPKMAAAPPRGSAPPPPRTFCRRRQRAHCTSATRKRSRRCSSTPSWHSRHGYSFPQHGACNGTARLNARTAPRPSPLPPPPPPHPQQTAPPVVLATPVPLRLPPLLRDSRHGHGVRRSPPLPPRPFR